MEDKRSKLKQYNAFISYREKISLDENDNEIKEETKCQSIFAPTL